MSRISSPVMKPLFKPFRKRPDMKSILYPCLALSFFVMLSSAAIAPDDPMIPDNHRIAVYLNCGESDTETSASGETIALLSGQPHTFPGMEGPVASCFFDPGEVAVELSGLDPSAVYTLGFTWWDADQQNRKQSVRFGIADPPAWTTVLPPAPAAAFDAGKSIYARGLLPLAKEFAGQQRLRVVFAREAGPNVVVSEVWLLKRTGEDAKKRVLVITGDDYEGHPWRETAPEMAAVLREDPRLEVAISECPAMLGSPLLDHYDAVVVHFKDYAERLPLGAEVAAGLTRYTAAGNGVVLSHFACGAFQERPEFVKVAGRVWNPALRGHDPHGVFRVRMTEEAHPVTVGMSEFEVLDELYTCLDGDTPIRVLADAVSVVDQKTYPMAFVVEGTGGRVFHCVLGHDTRAYAAQGARDLYRRGTAWAAGLDPEIP